MKDESNDLYSASFAPLLRKKTIAIWSAHQVAIAFLCIAVYVIALVSHVMPFSWRLLPLLALFIADLLVFHRMSIWQIIALKAGLMFRRATGRSKATVSPITVGSTVGFLDVPGSGDEVDTYRIVNAGQFRGSCFLWDPRKGEATAPLLLQSLDARFLSAREKTARAVSFSNVMRSLADRPDIKRVTIQSRSLWKPTPRTAEAGESMADRDIVEVESKWLRRTMSHDCILCVTVDPSKAPAGMSRRARAEDVGKLLIRRVTELCNQLEAAGVRRGSIWWLDSQQLRAQMKLLNDPDAFSLLKEYGRLPDDVPVQTAWKEYEDHMVVGNSCARTYWIDEWPDKRVPAAWLADLTGAADFQLICTQVFKHRSGRDAKKALDKQFNETETVRGFNTFLGRPDDESNENERLLLQEQREEAAKQHGDILFQGFLTVISPDLDSLKDDCARLAAKTDGRMHLDQMRDQQLHRWIGALPLGLEGRR